MSPTILDAAAPTSALAQSKNQEPPPAPPPAEEEHFSLISSQVCLQSEERKELDKLRNQIFKAHKPQDAMEKLLVDRIVACAWRLHRSGLIESQYIDYLIQTRLKSDGKSPEDMAARAQVVGRSVCEEMRGSVTFDALQRYESHLTRHLDKALAVLQDYRDHRRESKPELEAPQSKAALEEQSDRTQVRASDVGEKTGSGQ